MVWGCFPALGFMLLRAVASGLSYPRPIMLIVFWGTLFNITGNYILAFGKLGLPKLEIAGLAIASFLFLIRFTQLVRKLTRSQLNKFFSKQLSNFSKQYRP